MAGVTPSNVSRAPTVPVAGRVGPTSPTRFATSSPRPSASKPLARRVRYLNVGNPTAVRVPAAAAHGRGGRSAPCATATTVTVRRRESRPPAKRSPPSITTRGWPMTAGPRAHHRGHVGSDRARAERARRRRAARCSSRCRPIRSTRRCWRSSARARVSTGRDPRERMEPDFDHLEQARHRRRHARSSSSIPTIRQAPSYSSAARRQLIDVRRTARPRDSRRRGLRRSRIRRPDPADRQPRAGRGDHVVLEPVEGLRRAGLADRLGRRRPIAAARQRAVGALKKLADGRLCSTVPMQYAMPAALTRRSDRTRPRSARRCGSARR